MSDVRKIIDLDRLSRFKDDMDQEIAVQTPAISGNKLTIGSLSTPIAQDIVNVNDINGVPTTAYGSAAAARAAVDASSGLRIQGQIITYLLADGWYTDQYIGSATDSTSWGTASNWKTLGPVSVSQNTETGKTELKIGDNVALTVDKEPEVDSHNLVESGGVETTIKEISINRSIINDKAYNTNNGNIVDYTGRCISNKIRYIDSISVDSDAIDEERNCDVLFWSNNTYLGYARNSIVEPTTWVAVDHTLPITHIAFSWLYLKSSYFYKYIGLATKKYVDAIKGLLNEQIAQKADTTDVVETNNKLLILNNAFLGDIIYREHKQGTYNDLNGSKVVSSSYRRTDKIAFIKDAITNIMSGYVGDGGSREVLYWHENTYLGYTKNTIYTETPINWVAADHSLEVTHIAFTWHTSETDEDVFYTKRDLRIPERFYIPLINGTYNDIDGSIYNSSSYKRTGFIPFIKDAFTDGMDLLEGIGNRETLYWSNGTYLGYTKNSDYSNTPETWKEGVDHSLPVTHVAFTWGVNSNFKLEKIIYTYRNLKDYIQKIKDYVNGIYTELVTLINGKANNSDLTALTSVVNNIVNELQVITNNVSSLSSTKANSSDVALLNTDVNNILNAIDGIENTISTINTALSNITGSVPEGAITGDNIWTGSNVFAQPIQGVGGTSDDSVVILQQLHNGSISHRIENAADYGFNILNSASDNTTALQNALNGGNKTIVISIPGIYKVNSTILLYDNTELICGSGVIIQKDATYDNMFRNAGASQRTYNKNISIKNLQISVNNYGIVNNVDSTTFGLRGEVAFLCTNNVKIENFRCEDLGSSAYCIMFNQSTNFIIDGAIIRGNKDAIHISSVDTFVIRDVVIRTWDDAIALNSCDWISSNCVHGDIKNGIIDNVTDEYLANTSGFTCRLLVGAWVDWTLGMSIKRGDTVVHNGKLYRAYTPNPDTTEYYSQTEPTISTFAGKQEDTGGFYWKLMRDDSVYYSSNIENVVFRNIRCYSGRVCFNEEVDTDSEYNRSLYPTVPYADYPKIEVSIDGIYCSNNSIRLYNSVKYNNSYLKINNAKGPKAIVYYTYPIDSSLHKRLDISNTDFSNVLTDCITAFQDTEVNITNCVCNGAIASYIRGSINADCNITPLPPVGFLGNIIKYQNVPMVHNGTTWVSLIPNN